MFRACAIALATALALATSASAQCPETPGNVTVAVSGCSPVITWTSTTSPLIFHILRSTSNLANATQIGFASGTARQYTDTSADPAATYRYWVRAVGLTTPSCPSGQSPAAGYPSTVSTTLAAPADLTTLQTCATLYFQWSAVPGATGYRAILETANGTPIIDETVTNETVFFATALMNESPSRFRLYTLNPCGQSLTAATTQFSVQYPIAPLINATVSNSTICQTTLSWSRGSGLDFGVNITRRPTSGFPILTHTFVVPAGTTSFTDTSADVGREYSYQLSPRTSCDDGLGTRPPSTTLLAQIAPPPSLGTAQPLRPLVGSTATLTIPVPPSAATALSWWKLSADNTSYIRLTESARFTGTDSTTLTIHNIMPDDNGLYAASADYSCQDATVTFAVIINDTCKADFNADGDLTINDLFDYLNRWFAGCP